MELERNNLGRFCVMMIEKRTDLISNLDAAITDPHSNSNTYAPCHYGKALATVTGNKLLGFIYNPSNICLTKFIKTE